MMIGQYFFLGATLRDVTSQSVRHHNKHSFIKRIHDVKTVSVQYTRTILSLDSIFCYKVCGFNYKFDLFFLYFELYSNLAIAKFIPRYIRILFRLIC